jgi:TonB family protein
MTAANAVAWFAQIAVVVAACAALPRLLGVRAPTLQHVFWRAVLGVCLLLPAVQPWRPHEMAFVPAAAIASPSGVAAAQPPAAPGTPPVNWLAIAAEILGAGVLIRLAWIGLGLARLRRLRGGALEPADGFDDLRQAIGAGDVPIFWSHQASHPVTFGAMRPVILLPVALRSVEPAAQRAVVAHELHHVTRHDWLWTIGEEIVRAVFWFHPAMWWLISRVQLARETVVDELSILTTNARRVYLDTLLAFADEGGVASSPAFSARRHLFHRVMLLSKEETMSPIRIALVSCVLIVALGAGSFGAARAFPLRGDQAAAQALPPPASALEARQANQTLATSYFQIAQNDASLTVEQKLAAIAKGIAAEDRVLAIDPNYVPALIYKGILLRMQAKLTPDRITQQRLVAEADELRQTAIVLRGGSGTQQPFEVAPDGSMPPPPPPPPAQMAFMPRDFERRVQELNPVRIGGTVKQPMKIRDVKPVYPPIARDAHVQGVVIIEALIGTDGSVETARVLRSIPLLDEAALDAVRQWRFAPTTIDGVPQSTIMTLTVNFVLPQ